MRYAKIGSAAVLLLVYAWTFLLPRGLDEVEVWLLVILLTSIFLGWGILLRSEMYKGGMFESISAAVAFLVLFSLLGSYYRVVWFEEPLLLAITLFFLLGPTIVSIKWLLFTKE
tara:strand:- start:2266 stop:2607 length:342 start_codon:yes stop_codon:yes gene_type:complete